MQKIAFVGMSALLLCLSACSNDDLVGEVNGNDITKAEYQAYLEHKQVPVDNKEKVNAELDNYLARAGVVDVILDQGVLDEEKIKVEINEFKKQMVVSRYMEQYLAKQVDEQAVRNFYSGNMERFQQKKAHVAHILLRTNPKMSDEERQALSTRAHEIYSRAMAGEAFADLALEYSDDKLSSGKGGDLGWVPEGAIDPAFTKTAFELETDAISEPFATPFGYHIIKVLEAAQVVAQPFEAVSGNIRYELRQKAKQAEMERLQSLVSIENYGFADE